MNSVSKLSDFTKRMEDTYPHLTSVKEIRQQAARLANSILSGLKQARKNSGLKQGDVADALGMSQSSISRFENDVESMSLEMIGMYAAACGHRVAFVLIPDNEALQNEKISSSVIGELVEQLYPVKATFLRNEAVHEEKDQVKKAMQFASYGLASLGVALQSRQERMAAEGE